MVIYVLTFTKTLLQSIVYKLLKTQTLLSFIQSAMELTEEQRKQIEANRLAAIAKRKAFLESSSSSQQQQRNPWQLFKCQKISQPKPQPQPGFKFLARLEICSHDSFTITPLPIPYFAFPSFDVCFGILNNILAQVSYYLTI